MWAALGLTLTACGSAHAFYWQGWPGSRLRVPETLITQTNSREPVQPPPEFPIRDQPPPTPNPTPEPATGLLGLFGIGALAAVRRWRRK